MRVLELLAPARNADIGIAAIDCGADAVYLAGPAFGARKDAGNSIEEIARLCSYAHKFGARVFLTVNTILYDNELAQARQLMIDAQEAGVDAFIVQDLAVFSFEGINVPLHASTQCAIRDVQTARFYESLGAGRLVLERELSIEKVKEIRKAVSCELEFFIHGALCVCYSGQCYMSERIAGRSANRGECIQACRSLYDLEDSQGRMLLRNKALLSLKDYELLESLGALAEAGVCSFKIEGRLKNASYVKNVVRSYSLSLDAFINTHRGEYRRAAFGKVSGGFTPDLSKTFNRGYTRLFLDGARGKWASAEAPKSMGEEIGRVVSIKRLNSMSMELGLELKKGVVLRNGDGFAKGVFGFRGDVCQGNKIVCKSSPEIRKGDLLFRNINSSFEKELDREMPVREIGVQLFISISEGFSIDILARSEDGREVRLPFEAELEAAENHARAEALLREQLSKRSLHYKFELSSLEILTEGGRLPFMSVSSINSLRRMIASKLEEQSVHSLPLAKGKVDASADYKGELSYKANIANSSARSLLSSRLGTDSEIAPAYEIAHQSSVELMRTKYCIRYELGLCPVHQKESSKIPLGPSTKSLSTDGSHVNMLAAPGPLYLLNNGRRFKASFDCTRCEMTITEA